ncbi:MAG: Uncharacterized protein G01um101418_124 [Parcubacteria group bacterium Gr01-1014_18]|nr:MAG: Uncharacterized protein Greene041636_428 [Parcubacteria group bacterium Greene0416_36]TSC81451.1 MAG: Uncharacterized protein G01um101418_124 [Parcubacteria group bacterium Gr01-1014_18]TSC99049.1 MAG: Uncharacterized protein Greene101420_405 [Parcubacteria group bacterium Greene1014_20]TSD07270.1 MAG: Uncharacterized protein Greene07142_286 [Parcubacteria group bacterium Greene0714_2]
MTYKQRFLIFLVFVGVFALAAPGLLLYTTGHRIDWETLSIEKYGAIVFKTFPQEVTIAIENKTYAKSRNLQMISLAPGIYPVEVNREGFLKWNKNVLVQANSATLLRYIQLFSKNEPVLLFPDKINRIYFSSETNEAIIWSGNKLLLTQLEPFSIKKQILEIPPEYKVDKIEWLYQNRQVLAEIKKGEALQFVLLGLSSPYGVTFLNPIKTELPEVSLIESAWPVAGPENWFPPLTKCFSPLQDVTFICQNGNSIVFLDKEKKQMIELTKSEKDILEFYLDQSDNYLTLVTAESISMVEIYPIGGINNKWTLLEGGIIYSTIQNNQDRRLYFHGIINDKEGLYRLIF